jgi:hypothetical protein
MDGHNSHYGLQLIRKSREDNVVILGYPPHCTHALQGLDVMCFGPFKKVFHEDIHDFEREHNRGVKKDEFAEIFGNAFVQVFTPALIKKAFEVTGVYPFNPKAISKDKIAPSKATALTSSFPQLHYTPTRCIMGSFEHRRPTALECAETETDPAIDPSLYTPTKRYRQLVSSLAGTESGSYLVDYTKPFSSATIIPHPVLEQPLELTKPDWSLTKQPRSDLERLTKSQLITRVENLATNLNLSYGQVKASNAVVKGSQAQVVFQHLHLLRMKSTLVAKEKEKTRGEENLRIVPDAHGMVLNSAAMQERVEAHHARKEKDAEEKAARKAAQRAKQKRKAEHDAKWKRMNDEWKEKRDAWKKCIEELGKRGVSKKDLPPAPRRPLRKDIEDTPGDLDATAAPNDNATQEDDGWSDTGGLCPDGDPDNEDVFS